VGLTHSDKDKLRVCGCNINFTTDGYGRGILPQNPMSNDSAGTNSKMIIKIGKPTKRWWWACP
jgi:hypothetical protein